MAAQAGAAFSALPLAAGISVSPSYICWCLLVLSPTVIIWALCMYHSWHAARLPSSVVYRQLLACQCKYRAKKRWADVCYGAAVSLHHQCCAAQFCCGQQVCACEIRAVCQTSGSASTDRLAAASHQLTSSMALQPAIAAMRF